MKQKNIIWYDGKFLVSDLAKINILSHGLHYGSGVFEGIRAYKTERGTAIFRLPEHIERLFRSASVFDIKIAYKKEEFGKVIQKTVRLNHLDECYIRPILFFGEGQMGLSPVGAKLHMAVAAWPWGAYLGGHKVLSVGISDTIRFHPKSVVPGAKISGFYAASVLASIEAKRRGFDECILLDHEGNVSEGPGENIFMVKKNKLYTPDSPSILPGITRQTIMTIAKDIDMRVFKKKISPKELIAADEVFFTGTAVEVKGIGSIDGKKIGDGGIGPRTEQIQQLYSDIVHGKNRRYQKWLTRA